jgi:hypothetical protein
LKKKKKKPPPFFLPSKSSAFQSDHFIIYSLLNWKI